jgi:hypothetical protein
VKIGKGVRQRCCLSRVLFNVYNKYLAKEALEGFEVGGQVIRTEKYADDLVLLAKEEMVLQGLIDRLIKTGRCYGIEMNMERTKVIRISRQPSRIQIMIDQKQRRM